MNQVTDKPNSAEKSKNSAIRLSIVTATSLTFLKVILGLATQSMSVVASAVDSLMDILVSTVNYISLREASKPADYDHAYGHGKIESLAGLFQSLFISGSGIFLVYESCRRLIHGQMIVHIGTAIWVMVVSTIATFFLVRRLQSVASRTNSLIVGTEALHFTTDLVTNVGVVLALLLVRWSGHVIWDLLIALVIALYILKQSFGIMKNAIDELIDRALPEEIQADIRKLILSYDSRVLGLHNLRTRKIGDKKFVDFHVELDKSLGFEEAHNLTEDLIEAIKKRYPDSDVNAHFDPQGGR